MGTICQEGFLSKDIELWIKENEQKKDLELNLAKDTNVLAQSIFLNSAPRGDRGLLIASIFARILEHFQAIIILEERNITNSSNALVRVILEATFSLVACVKNDNFHYKLADWDSLAKKRLGEHLQKVSPNASPLTIEEIERINEQVQQASEEVKDLKKHSNDDSELKVFRIAKYADMEDFYHSIYSLFSLTVHSAVRSLSEHVGVDASGDIKSILWGPDQKQGYGLITATAIVLHSMESYLFLHPSPNFTSQLNPLLKKLRLIEERNFDNLDNSDKVSR
jgi:hypothetical protein